MHPKQKEAFVRALKTMLAFHRQSTPGGVEYARRMKLASAALARGQYERAGFWINLCDVS